MIKYKVYYSKRNAAGLAREHSRTFKANDEAEAVARLMARLPDHVRPYAAMTAYAVVAPSNKK